MMNTLCKFKTLFLSLVVISSALSATQQSGGELTQKGASFCTPQPSVELKAGYFFFLDSKLRKVYDKGGLDVQFCASYPLWNLTRRWTLSAYGAVEYFYRSGKSMNENQKTALWSVPVSVGLKPAYRIGPNMYYYCAAGPRYFYVHQHNSSSYVPRNNSRNCLGLFVNTGFNYLVGEHFVIDVFGEYSYGKVRFHGGSSQVYTSNVQMGGFTFGGGLGYSF
ncbi:hypothetical protein [Estrella lausannensis]|uniref:Putative secreted protein n=1 Tax=Estrella lausannensis TaxID=483423 RepID=A0A0H5DTL4_9BACT|nr:hypothetical protein [Estrella lausannensis]CRX39204.1 putative secreted protein [Estrella lausannensis]